MLCDAFCPTHRAAWLVPLDSALIALDCVLRKGAQSNWPGKQARICVATVVWAVSRYWAIFCMITLDYV